ncbi:hypothetical protein FZI85_13615 [Mycobacterium sp. CBMA293]|uniref:DUF3566 domain-containing protein n=1 Tax=unclassified Mycolicibacterium TaxID=2636767 RepID=UPI00132B3A29|nr:MULTISPECIES: DUF3566 domain-containing protein [unclassified Mycolicibacterium]MUL49744.1 hypothetical protein [Mycolicibacterium sp. CBMA 360]MUL94938.1 hypothetical protein [Mycolicibacterium sp. CBMA 230]MUL59570.1 hypothetical protein [Mycolicibacterium sp. CBMA 335]MUL71295.1 hypothetical protein [Mycolicibacterium sp. CBMA 311]MUM03776.1 hypothetical protein [Mycolicibacterium sp. CBMA 213]
MSSPNEPGYTRTGDGPTSNSGPATGSGGGAHAADQSGEAPPWQRARTGSAGDAPTATGPSLDDRLNRFVSGSGSAAEAETTITPAITPDAPAVTPMGNVPPKPVRTEAVRPEPRPEGRPDAAYASEIPDLSRQAPRRSVEPREPRTVATVSPARSAGPRNRAAARQDGPVRASMQVRRVDPWSVLKVSLVLSVALFFVWMIAVAFLYLVLGGMGVWSKLNSNVGDLLTSGGGSGGELVSASTIFGGATLIGLVNIVLLTAMAVTAAFVYNLTTDLVGGVEVTLADRD